MHGNKNINKYLSFTKYFHHPNKYSVFHDIMVVNWYLSLSFYINNQLAHKESVHAKLTSKHIGMKECKEFNAFKNNKCNTNHLHLSFRGI
jgi:hypothetical protein